MILRINSHYFPKQHLKLTFVMKTRLVVAVETEKQGYYLEIGDILCNEYRVICWCISGLCGSNKTCQNGCTNSLVNQPCKGSSI
jgi:hypothetical protein